MRANKLRYAIVDLVRDNAVYNDDDRAYEFVYKDVLITRREELYPQVFVEVYDSCMATVIAEIGSNSLDAAFYRAMTNQGEEDWRDFNAALVIEFDELCDSVLCNMCDDYFENEFIGDRG